MSNQTKHVPYVIKTNGSITMYLKGESMTVETDHRNYSKIVDALKTGNFEAIDHLVNIAKAVSSYAKGTVRIDNGTIFFGNFALHNTLTNRILKMMNEGFKFDHMMLFLNNLMQNPSSRAVNETYTFLENHGLPITDDGCFLAYKAVRNNYTDIHSGKFDNSVGATPSMPRNMVDENYEVDCSNGLHVGSLGYVIEFGHFTRGVAVGETGNRLLIVKVNPRDVVSVPKYADHTKMRVSTYVVVDEIKDVVKELDKVVYSSTAKEIVPDEPVNTEAPAPATVSTSYDDGFDAGVNDYDNGLEYGETRDYSLTGNYLKGYNDGYNGRDYNNPNSENGLADKGQDVEFDAGYSLGCSDFNQGLDYFESLGTDASDTFKDGYRAGYNDDNR